MVLNISPPFCVFFAKEQRPIVVKRLSLVLHLSDHWEGSVAQSMSFFLHRHNFWLNFSPRKSAKLQQNRYSDKTAYIAKKTYFTTKQRKM